MRCRIFWLISTIVITLVTSLKADPSQQHLSEQFMYPVFSGDVLRPEEPPGIEMTERGRNIRGVYAPVSKLVLLSPKKLLEWIKSVGADAVIVDIKDDKGRVTFTKKLPLAKGTPHGIVSKMKQHVKILKKNNIYIIGRLVCFKDDIFHKKNPKEAIRDRRDSKIWRDRANMAWLDPYSLKAHEYITSIAKEAENFGFDEIQLDYVRFPVDGQSRYARYTNREKNMERYKAIALLLARVDRSISIPLSIDVFGLTAHTKGDKQGLGQSLEHLSPYLDAISPMLYVANFPKKIWEDPDPKIVYGLVNSAVKRIRTRLADTIAVRPLLQGFSYRAADFSVRFINNQIDAAKTAGSSGYLFWNQSGNYLKVSIAWKRLEKETNIDKKSEEKESPKDNENVEKNNQDDDKTLEVASNQ